MADGVQAWGAKDDQHKGLHVEFLRLWYLSWVVFKPTLPLKTTKKMLIFFFFCIASKNDHYQAKSK